MNLKEDLKKYQDSNGNFNGMKLKYSGLIEQIINATSFLDPYNPSNRERIHCILHDITDVVYCPITKEKLKYSPSKKQYVNSITYSRKNNKRVKKFDYKSRNQSIWNDIVSLYKSNNFSLIEKDTCLKLYEQHTSKEKAVISITKALLHIDLVCSIFKHTEFMEIKSLNLAERYFCIKNNITNIQLDYRGYPLKFRDCTSGYSVYADKNTMYKHKLDMAESVILETYTINEYIRDYNEKGNAISRMSLTCNDCGHKFISLFKNGLWKKTSCPKCNDTTGRSKIEIELVDFIKASGIDNILENDRQILNGFELDIYLPDYKLAIEMCGLTWHSFGTTFPNNIEYEKDNKYRHYTKYTKCKELGIQLLTIFEHEWKYKKELVKSMILNKLNISETRIFARKCRLQQVDSKEASKFLLENHIQGNSTFSEAYGLYYNCELVSLMCFGKRKLTRGICEYELIRFCNKINTNVIGGASRLLKFSNKNKFISYCDLRYSDGNLYHKLGMKLLRTTPPNYFYVKDLTVYHRMRFQKHKISIPGDSRTEREIMYENKYRRIYDCGNLVFSYAPD